MLKNKFFRKKYIIPILIVILLSIPSVMYLFQKGFFLSDDGEWMVIRFSAFYQTLGNGQIPPRFFGRLNHGFGYPIGVFLYPAFMYLATPLKLIGLGYADAIKTILISSFILSGVGTFLWLRFRFSVLPAIIGALVYVYFPYHLYDLYVRGSVGELVGFAVLPFLLISIDKKNIPLSALFYGLLILSHNTFAFLLTPFLMLYTYFQNRVLLLLYPLGLLASAFFWVPSLLEISYTRFSDVVISEWQNYFLTRESSSIVGLIGFLIVVFSIIGIIKGEKLVRYFSVVVLLSFFFATSFSSVLWSVGILPKLVQFPWRFLIVTVWAGSFITAYVLDSLDNKKRVLLTLIVAGLIGISALPILQEYKNVQRDEGFYFTNEDTTTTHGEYMPKWVKKIPSEHPQQPAFWQKGEGDITLTFQNSNRTQLVVNSSQGGSLVLNKIYYPGWKAEINGNTIPLSVSKEGYVLADIPKGTSHINYSFGETPLRLMSNTLSFITITVLMMFVLFPQWYNTLALWKRK